VDWRPWGTEAFDTARRENKPIFLSIGYSTCHWCHVMEHESFENREIADVLNRHFVSIKVDREERPDVDRVYMTFVQVTTGSGGWPMSVWLTPSLQPFYGGTYFPPTSKWGKPGFVDVLEEIARVWREERDKVEQSAATIKRERLDAFAEVRVAALLPVTTGRRRSQWYDISSLDPAARFDLIIVDGPPAWRGDSPARLPALYQLRSHLSDDGVLVLDDAQHGGESEIARRWQQDFPDLHFRMVGLGRGLFVATVQRTSFDLLPVLRSRAP